MAYNKLTKGPNLWQCYGGSMSNPTTCFETSTASWEKREVSTVQKRTRPTTALQFCTQLTSYTIYKNRLDRAMIYMPYGNFGPAGSWQSGDYSVPQAARTGSLNAARTQFLRNLKDEQWNLSVFMAELPSTWKFFRSAAEDIFRFYTAARRGNLGLLQRAVRINSYRWQDAVRTVDQTTNVWLAWRYAVRPLLYDLDDVMKTLYRARLNLYIHKVYGSARDRWVENITSAQGSFNKVSEWKWSVGAYCRIDPHVAAFHRLGTLNPVEVMWELVPLSFVVDWFLPIGTYLAGLDAAAGTTYLGKWQADKGTRAQRSQGATTVHPVHGATYYTQGRFFTDYYTRSNGWPGWSGQPPLPKFQIGVDAQQFLDALALLWQRVPRR